MNVDTPLKTLIVAIILCVVCSILVSTSAVILKPLQESNKQLDIQKNILEAARLFPTDTDTINRDDISQIFQERIKQQVVSVGEHEQTVRDIYLVKDKTGYLQSVVLPVEGRGLWSTLYGFLALKPDMRTVVGMGFYQHGETPGLGGEVDNPNWKASWRGKQVSDEQLQPVLRVLKGSVNPQSPKAIHQIDGLSGATITARGVEALVNHWIGPEGYGPYLASLLHEMQKEDEDLTQEAVQETLEEQTEEQ